MFALPTSAFVWAAISFVAYFLVLLLILVVESACAKENRYIALRPGLSFSVVFALSALGWGLVWLLATRSASATPITVFWLSCVVGSAIAAGATMLFQSITS